MSREFPRSIAAALVVTAAGCMDSEPSREMPLGPRADLTVAPPAALVDVAFGAETRTIWPFTGRNFTDAADPINLIFVGASDPLSLREALLSLDGNRVPFGFPPVAPFDCTWSDAIGGVQTGFSNEGGWTGSAIQLGCGGYGPIRFHLRLFDAGGWTLGGAHFEVLIPGTADHEVLSWELAQQFVAVDFLRAGILDASVPFAPTAAITPVPSYRTINPQVYNGLPAALIAALGGPPQPVGAPVPIANDGAATILNVAHAVTPAPVSRQTEFTLVYGQIVPRPFCSAGPQDFVRVDGPVSLAQSVEITAEGDYASTTRITGALQVTPFGAPGPARTADIERHAQAIRNPAGAQVDDRFRQVLRELGDLPRQSSLTRLRVGRGNDTFTTDVRCE